MSVGKREPVPLLGKVVVWGLPKHGLVRDGVITLANTNTEAYVQPLASAEVGDWSGADTLLVLRPGWSAPTLDPAEQAAHIAAGRDFRGYALISGAWRDLAEQSLDLGSWLAFAPDGSCWWWNLTGVSGAEPAFVMAFQRRRFGLFDGETYAFDPRATPAFSLGQSGAPDLEVRDADGTTRLLPQTGIATPYCVSIAQGGAKSLWMLMTDHYSPWHTSGIGSTIRERPIAFIEATITGSGIAAATIRTRAQCMGARTNTITGGGALRISATVSTSEQAIGTCEDLSTIYETTYTAGLALDDYDAPASASYTVPLSFSEVGALSPQIVAMWYDAAGVLHEITLDIAISYVITHSGAGGASGQVVHTQQCGAPTIKTGSLHRSRTDDYTVAESCTLTLRDNGALMLQKTVGRSTTASVDYQADSDADFNALPGNGWFVSVSTSLTLDGALVGSHTTSESGYDFLLFSGMLHPVTLALAAPADANDNKRQFSAIPMRAQIIGGAQVVVDLVRWSNNAIGFRVQRAAPGDPVNGLSRHEFSDVITPAGVIPHSRVEDFAGPVRVRCSGSVEPMEGLFASSVSEDAAGVTHEPVCWV